MSQILSKGLIPGGIIVATLHDGNHFIELFREKLLPELLRGKYQVESAEFGMVGPKPVNGERWGPREWGIGTMKLVARGNTLLDLDTKSPIEPLMRVRRSTISGWFNRLVETNKEAFLYEKIA